MGPKLKIAERMAGEMAGGPLQGGGDGRKMARTGRFRPFWDPPLRQGQGPPPILLFTFRPFSVRGVAKLVGRNPLLSPKLP